MKRLCLCAALLSCLGSAGGQTPRKYFELEIPEFGDRPFDANEIEVPIPVVNRLVIHLLNPVADDIDYSKIFTKLNGEATTTLQQGRRTLRGKAIHLDLKARADLRLSPGVNTLEVSAVNRRGRIYYKNFILRTREQARNEWFAYDFAKSPDDESATPPDVLLLEPPASILLPPGEKSQPVLLKGKITAGHPLSRITVNGAAWPGQLGKTQVEFEHKLAVSPKDKSVTVEVSDSKGNRTRVTVPVQVVGAGAPLRLTGDRWAVVVGISRFGVRPGGPPNLHAASADAKGFADMLTTRAGFAAERVWTFLDDKATRAQLHNSFRNHVAKARPDDLLVVYVATYGMHDPGNPDKLYLAAYDTQIGQMGATALELGELRNLLRDNLRSRQAVLIFDVGRGLANDWTIPGGNLVNAYLLRAFAQQQGWAVLVSGGVNEVSQERQSAGGHQGVFARWLIEALEGKADWNQDRLLTVGELFRYVADNVRRETNKAQNPRFALTAGDDAILAAAPR